MKKMVAVIMSVVVLGAAGSAFATSIQVPRSVLATIKQTVANPPPTVTPPTPAPTPAAVQNVVATKLPRLMPTVGVR